MWWQSSRRAMSLLSVKGKLTCVYLLNMADVLKVFRIEKTIHTVLLSCWGRESVWAAVKIASQLRVSEGLLCVLSVCGGVCWGGECIRVRYQSLSSSIATPSSIICLSLVCRYGVPGCSSVNLKLDPTHCIENYSYKKKRILWFSLNNNILKAWRFTNSRHM